jgi:hypothetical protein
MVDTYWGLWEKVGACSEMRSGDKVPGSWWKEESPDDRQAN